MALHLILHCGPTKPANPYPFVMRTLQKQKKIQLKWPFISSCCTASPSGIIIITRHKDMFKNKMNETKQGGDKAFMFQQVVTTASK